MLKSADKKIAQRDKNSRPQKVPTWIQGIRAAAPLHLLQAQLLTATLRSLGSNTLAIVQGLPGGRITTRRLRHVASGVRTR